MSGFADTLINIVIFCFIGLLIWLYVMPGSGDGD